MTNRTTVAHRAAVAIYECVTDCGSITTPSMPLETWGVCCRHSQLLRKAELHGFTRAANRQRKSLAESVRRLKIAGSGSRVGAR